MRTKRSSGMFVFVMFLILATIGCMAILLNEVGAIDLDGLFDSLVPQEANGPQTQVAYAWRTVQQGDSGTGIDDVKLFTFFKREGDGRWTTTGNAHYQFPMWW